MTQEQKLLTEQQAACILMMEPAKALAELHERGLIAEEPVDPLREAHMAEVRSLCEHEANRMDENGTGPARCRAIARGKGDEYYEARIGFNCLRRGREIGLAERPELTRDELLKAVRAVPYGVLERETKDEIAARLHAALTGEGRHVG